MKFLKFIAVVVAVLCVANHLWAFSSAWSSFREQGMNNGTLAMLYFGIPFFTGIGMLGPASAIGFCLAPVWLQEFATTTPGKAWGVLGGAIAGVFLPNLILLAYTWMGILVIQWWKS